MNKIHTTIREALRDYPFIDDEQRALVHWREQHDFFYWGDQRLMKHVLWNLIKNALYYIKLVHQGELTIWTETVGNYHELHVKDTAHGIAEASLPNIFDRFYSTRPTGMGLGLAFCKAVMQAQDGHIRCQSKEGGWTHFILQFPITEVRS